MPSNPRGNPQWKPGVSGNPGGRPQGFAQLVRERTGARGETLFELFRQIAEGDVQFTASQKKHVERLQQVDPDRAVQLALLMEKLNMPSIKERMEAGKLLLEHSQGKPAEHVGLDATVSSAEAEGVNLERLSLAEVIAWRDLVRKAKGQSDDEAEVVEESALVVVPK